MLVCSWIFWGGGRPSCVFDTRPRSSPQLPQPNSRDVREFAWLEKWKRQQCLLSTPQQHCPLHGKCPAPRPVPLGDASPAAVEAPTSGAALLVLHPPAGVDSETCKRLGSLGSTTSTRRDSISEFSARYPHVLVTWLLHACCLAARKSWMGQ